MFLSRIFSFIFHMFYVKTYPGEKNHASALGSISFISPDDPSVVITSYVAEFICTPWFVVTFLSYFLCIQCLFLDNSILFSFYYLITETL